MPSEAELLASIRDEVRAREVRGEAVALDEYERRYPHLVAELRELFAGHGTLVVEPPAPKAYSPDAVIAELSALRLAEGESLDRVRHAFTKPSLDAVTLGRLLLAEAGLTAFQVNRFLQGEGARLNVGPYRLLSRLGEGGMGQVFRARDEAGRLVALKLIHGDRVAGPGVARRFAREARAAARLSHPNIVAWLGSGEAEGTPYLVLELLEGRDLARMVREDGSPPVPVACEYARQAALALQHAHEKGLVHRDVKPSNFMVVNDVVKLLDLGLARILHAPGDDPTTSLTARGTVAGTPDYIAPEQIHDAASADIRADLYGLGCTLYFLLAGKPPFAGASLAQKLVMHQTAPPPPLRDVRREIPAVVVAVVERLLAKKPEDRYQTPADLAEVLGRLLTEGRCEAVSDFDTMVGDLAGLITPRPPAPPKGLSRLLWASATLLGVALAGAVVRSLLAPAPEEPGPPKQEAPVARTGPPLDRLRREDVPKEERELLPDAVVAVLGSSRGRHWGAINDVAFSPDGKALVSVGRDGLLQVWDSRDLRPKARARLGGPAAGLAFAANGEVTYAESGTGPAVWRKGLAADAKPVTLGTVSADRISPDGRRGFITTTMGATLYDLATGQVLFRSQGKAATHERGAGAAFSDDGKFAATVGSGKGEVVVLEAETGLVVRSFLDLHGATVAAIAFHPDGKRLVTGGDDHKVHFVGIDGARLASFEHPAPVRGLAVSRDGTRAVSCSSGGDKPIRVWPLAAGANGAAFGEWNGGYFCCAFHPDGKSVATGDGYAVRLWDAATGAALAGPGQTAALQCVALSPDESFLVVGGCDPGGAGRTARWDIGKARPAWRRGHRNVPVSSVAVSPAVQDVLVGDDYGKLYALDAESGAFVRDLPHPEHLYALAFAPGGKQVWLGGGTTEGPDKEVNRDRCAIRAFEVATGRETAGFRGHAAPVRALAVSPDGKRLASAAWTGSFPENRVCLWDVATRTILREWPQPYLCRSLAFSPDGKRFAAASEIGVQVYAIDRDQAQMKLPAAAHVAFFPDGGLLTAGTFGVSTWSATGEKREDWPLPRGGVSAVAISKDGRHVLTANANGTVTVFRR